MDEERKKNFGLNDKVQALASEIGAKDVAINEMQAEVDKLRTQIANIHTSLMSSQSPEAPKTISKVASQPSSTNVMNLSHSSTERNMLLLQNKEMCEGMGQLQDEIAWLRLRDKKIMYLISLLNAKGYPVH